MGQRFPMHAVDVSRILVKTYIDRGSPTTNLKLQKLLYFAWIEYYNKFRRYLFKEYIRAWKLGPVVVESYMEFRPFAALPITFTKEPIGNVSSEDRIFLEEFASRYLDRTASHLVSRSHNGDTPWKAVYREGENRIIPFDLIIRKECS